MKCSGAAAEDKENPKLILIASELVGNEKVRKTLLYVLFFSLGLIMLIFVVFIGLISGLLSVAQDNDLRNHWNYYRTSISEVFGGIEGEINSDVKSEVYDFMPEFSVNLSKATIANNFFTTAQWSKCRRTATLSRR